jgi:hypothetical protein
MAHDEISNFDEDPIVQECLKALPLYHRTLPSWCAYEYLKLYGTPLQKAILSVLALPSAQQDGAWNDLARQFKVHRTTIWRHKVPLLDESVRLKRIALQSFHLVHGQNESAIKILKILGVL